MKPKDMMPSDICELTADLCVVECTPDLEVNLVADGRVGGAEARLEAFERDAG